MAESLSSRELLEDAARRSIRYREGLASRGVAPSAGAVAGLSALDEPMPDEPLPPQDGAAAAGRGRLAGDDGDGRAALLRLRHRRLAARHAGRQLAGRRLGSELGLLQRHARHRAARAGRPALAARSASICRAGSGGAFVTGATMANFSALAAARHAVLAARRLERRGRWAVRRAADHGDRRRGSPPHPVQVAGAAGAGAEPAGQGAGGCPGTDARRRPARAIGARRSSACRPAT